MLRDDRTSGFSRTRRASGLLSAAALALAVALGSSTTGCRTKNEDVHRWANTAQGPRKLIAVLTHQKYPIDLRVEAALTLIRMKPRGGRRIGIQGSDDQPGLVDALAQLSPAERAKVLDRLVPAMVAEMRRPPPKAQAGQAAAPDASYPYKDAAFALLTHDGGSIVADERNRRALRDGLREWTTADFAARMDESSQIYGIEQVLRELKAEGVRTLPELIDPGARKIDRIADLVAELGDSPTKLRASQKLVEVAREVGSDRWIKQKAPAVEAANKASKLNPTPEQFKAQLETYQEEELLRVFASMKKVGGAPAVDYLLEFAQNELHPEKRRAAALAALEGNLDKNNSRHAEIALAIASGKDTPDVVRDIALLRVGEFPRKVVVSKLYELFEHDNWKVRWVAAELVLKMSEPQHIDEFMQRVGNTKHLAITEPLRYGALMGSMKGSPAPKQLIDKYVQPGHPVQARLSAFGYYFDKGTKEDLPAVEPYVADAAKVEGCKEGAQDCEWKCTVGEGEQQETKDITTVGEFVRYCVKPAMEKRKAQKQKQ